MLERWVLDIVLRSCKDLRRQKVCKIGKASLFLSSTYWWLSLILNFQKYVLNTTLFSGIVGSPSVSHDVLDKLQKGQRGYMKSYSLWKLATRSLPLENCLQMDVPFIEALQYFFHCICIWGIRAAWFIDYKGLKYFQHCCPKITQKNKALEIHWVDVELRLMYCHLGFFIHRVQVLY